MAGYDPLNLGHLQVPQTLSTGPHHGTPCYG
jgi:hypothetical protein